MDGFLEVQATQHLLSPLEYDVDAFVVEIVNFECCELFKCTLVFHFKFSDFGGFLVLKQTCYKSGVINVIYDPFLCGW